MNMKIKCGHCGKTYEVDDAMTGRKAECGACKQKFIMQPVIEHTIPPTSPETIGVDDENLILGLYRMTDEVAEGGMGKVFKVHHTTWNVDLAMKRPHPKYFETDAHKSDFIRECEAWINLGLHPNIVACYYVREIDGVPNIFAEWMDGGSLSQWIEEGRLYEGSENEVLKRILDIAIQSAWGLGYAHDQGLIHQDVKPENILLTYVGDAKICDFGIANAKSGLMLSETMSTLIDGTMYSESGSYTPSYCSPEQANGKKLTRRTDIWSWAISVMEMFVGERQWQSGAVAGSACNDYLASAKVAVPEAIAELLGSCFQEAEAERPRDFKEIVDMLLGFYESITGNNYERTKPDAAFDAPDSLNNRALSYVDMGQTEKAEKLWVQALQLDPLHLESTYNQGLHLWRTDRIGDMELIRRMENVRPVYTKSWRDEYLLAMIHLELCNFELALTMLESAADQSGHDIDVVNAINFTYKLKYKGQCIRTYEGHTDTVESVAFSPDGKFILSGSCDRTIKLWDLESGHCIRTYEGHSDMVFSVAFSPDGKFALSGSADKTLKLWNLENGQCIHTYEGHTDTVKSVAFSPDGNFALSGSSDHSIQLWEINLRKSTVQPLLPISESLINQMGLVVHPIRIFRGHENPINSISFFKKDREFDSVGSWDGELLKFWDVNTGQCLRTLKGAVYVNFRPDGKTTISSSDGKTFSLEETITGKCLHKFRWNEFGIPQTLAFSPDNNLALYPNDQTLTLLDIKKGRKIHKFNGTKKYICSIVFSPNGNVALTSYSYYGGIMLWDVKKVTIFADFELSKIRSAKDVMECELKFKNTLLTVNRKIKDNDINAALTVAKETSSLVGFERSPVVIKLKQKLHSYCGISKLQSIWLKSILDGHALLATSIAFSPDGKFVLSGSGDKTLKLWNLESGQCIHTYEGHSERVVSVDFSPDGEFALSGSADKTLKLWNLESGQCIHTYEGHSYMVCSVDFNPDGEFALSGSADKTLKLWNLENGQCIHTYEGHSDQVFSVDFSPDGEFALSGSRDKTLKLWDVKSGLCIRTYEGHTDIVCSVDFSPDGEFALSSSYDNTFKLWEISTGKCIITTEEFSSRLARFCPDGTSLLSGGRRINIWNLDWEYEFPGWSDWDDGAEPYLRIFLTLRNGVWNEDDFEHLVKDLQNRGYGWLRPEGVRAKLEEMTIDFSII